jgi:hypothetical protein
MEITTAVYNEIKVQIRKKLIKDERSYKYYDPNIQAIIKVFDIFIFNNLYQRD